MPSPSQVVRASVTPLASILGSGLLIIVPVLERTLGSLSVDDVRVEVVAGTPDGDGGVVVRDIVAGVPSGAAAAEQRFVAVVPASESGRLACAARVVPLRPDGVRTEPEFLVAWETT